MCHSPYLVHESQINNIISLLHKSINILLLFRSFYPRGTLRSVILSTHPSTYNRTWTVSSYSVTITTVDNGFCPLDFSAIQTMLLYFLTNAISLYLKTACRLPEEKQLWGTGTVNKMHAHFVHKMCLALACQQTESWPRDYPEKNVHSKQQWQSDTQLKSCSQSSDPCIILHPAQYFSYSTLLMNTTSVKHLLVTLHKRNAIRDKQRHSISRKLVNCRSLFVQVTQNEVCD